MMLDRVYNFSAGPSQLPLPVLEEAQKEADAKREAANQKLNDLLKK